jgi:hypothetical protein
MAKWGSVYLLGLCFALRGGAATLPEERASLEALKVLVLAPAEGRAVVQGAEGELHLLGLGDTLPGSSERIVAILSERLIAEGLPTKTGAPPRRFWIYRHRDSDGKTRVQAVDREAPPRPPVFRPLPAEPVKGKHKEATHGR